jgi:hypothetical protein
MDEVRGQDLAASSAVAEPLRENHRRAEVVLLVADRLPDVQTDANLKLVILVMALIVAMHRLLHGHGAGQSVESAPESHHEAVAQVLDLMPSSRRYGAAKEAEVRTP